MSDFTSGYPLRSLVGIAILSVVVLGVATQAAPYIDMCSCEDGGSGGGGSSDSLAKYNTTAILDPDADGGPVVAGEYVVGEVMNQVYVNLTNDTSYAIVNADDVAIANLTAQGNHVLLQDHEVNSLGTWALYLEDDWDGLGLLADPLLTFDVTKNSPDTSVGNYVHLVDDSTEKVTEVNTCHGKVEGFPKVTKPNGDLVSVELPSTGGFVVMNMTWESNNIGQDEFAEFRMYLGEEEHTRPLGADERMVAWDDEGVLRTVKRLEPDDSENDSVVTTCYAWGPGADELELEKTVTVDADAK